MLTGNEQTNYDCINTPEDWQALIYDDEPTHQSIHETRKGIRKRKIVFESDNRNLLSVISPLTELILKLTEIEISGFCCTTSNHQTRRYYFPYHTFDLNTIESFKSLSSKLGIKILKEVPIYGTDDYTIENLYNQQSRTIDEREFFKYFYLSNHLHFARHTRGFNPISRTYECLPILLSLSYGVQDIDREDNEEEDDDNQEDYTLESDQFFQDLLISVPTHIFRQYNIWFDIGMVIRNRYLSSQEGLDLWIEQTIRLLKSDKKAKQIDIHEIIGSDINTYISRLYKWSEKCPLTIKTLASIVREHNRTRYDSIVEAVINHTVSNITNGKGLSIARLLQCRYWLEIVYCKGSWYTYNYHIHRWEITDKSVAIDKKIITEFGQFIQEQSDRYKSEAAVCLDLTTSEHNKKMASLMDEMLNTINNVNLGPVIKALTALSNFELFGHYLDLDPRYTVLGNCVLEAVDYTKGDDYIEFGDENSKEYGHICVRAGRPEDYKSTGSHFTYDDTVGYKHEEMIRLEKWLRELYPDPLTRNFVNMFDASCLMGGNPDKCAIFYIGGGNNGKTASMKLMTLIFGESSVTLPASCIAIGSDTKGSATPELNLAWCGKIACISETDNMIISPKELKRLTSGGDLLFLRRLFKEGGNRPFHPKLVIYGNEMPAHYKPDPQAVDRVVIVPMVSRWTTEEVGSYEIQSKNNVYKCDRSFHKRLNYFASAKLRKMIDDYPKYKQQGLSVLPPIVTRVTKNYWYNKDTYAQFTQSTIKEAYLPGKTRDEDSFITVTSLYNAYLDYLRNKKPSATLPNEWTFEEQMSKQIGDPYGGKWWGIAMKSMRDMTDDRVEHKRMAKVRDYKKFVDHNVNMNKRMMYEK